MALIRLTNTETTLAQPSTQAHQSATWQEYISKNRPTYRTPSNIRQLPNGNVIILASATQTGTALSYFVKFVSDWKKKAKQNSCATENGHQVFLK